VQFICHRVSYFVIVCIIWLFFGCRYQRNRLSVKTCPEMICCMSIGTLNFTYCSIRDPQVCIALSPCMCYVNGSCLLMTTIGYVSIWFVSTSADNGHVVDDSVSK